jgi:hypothetical protein
MGKYQLKSDHCTTLEGLALAAIGRPTFRGIRRRRDLKLGWVSYVPILRQVVTASFYEEVEKLTASADPAVRGKAGSVLKAMEAIARISPG